MNEVPYPEKLARAMHARIVADGHFHHSESGPFKFFGHFHADYAAARFESDGVENMPSKQAEVAIDVADR